MSYYKHGEGYGENRTKEYNAWQAMIQRCERPKHPSYQRYGARGIHVCERWKRDYLAFLADMGRAGDGLTLDRIDNDKGYEPGNCRWASRKEQANNRHLKTVCYKGHPLVEGNYIVRKQGRLCLVCTQERYERFNLKRQGRNHA